MGKKDKTIKISSYSKESQVIKVKPPEETIDNKKCLFSFELFDDTAECPSKWNSNEIKQLFHTFQKACQRTWRQIKDTGGKSYGGKVGLGYTVYDKPPFPLSSNISLDIKISKMRVTDKARFFGFKLKEVFYILRLDKNHKL